MKKKFFLIDGFALTMNLKDEANAFKE